MSGRRIAAKNLKVAACIQDNCVIVNDLRWQASSYNVRGRSQNLHAPQIHCGSGLAREKPETGAYIQDNCVIVDDHRQQAGSHKA